MDDVSLLPELEDFISLLTEHTGIIPLATHKNSIVSYIVKKTQDISKETGIVDGKKLCNMFYNQLVSSKTEFNNFALFYSSINSSVTLSPGVNIGIPGG